MPVARFNAPAQRPVDALEVPFPSDLYLDAAGAIRLGKLPGTTNAQFTTALAAAWPTLDGWGVSTGVFFKIDSAIDPATIASSVHLYDLESGDEVPIEIGYNDAQGTIGGVPAPGHVLRESHRYGAVLLDTPRSASGAGVTPSSDFAALRAATSAPSDPRLAAAFAVVAPALDAAAAKGVPRDHIVAATAFRTQTILAPMEKLRTDLDASPPAAITRVLKVITQGELDTYLGTPTNAEEGLDAPGTSTTYAVQHSHIGWLIHANIGLKSYSSAAPGQLGLFQLDANGHPVAKSTIDVPFTLALPKVGCCAGLPLVVFQHGVTATRQRMMAVADGLAAQGIAVVAIDLPFHGSRLPNATDRKNDVTGAACTTSPCDFFGDEQGLTPPIFFFNLGSDPNVATDDPRVGRDNFRQAAADVMQLIRALTDGDLGPLTAASGAPAQLSFRPDRVAYVGYSLGSFVGLLIGAVDPRVQAFVLSSAGAGVMVPTLVDGPTFGTTFAPFLETGFGITGEFGTPTRDARFHPSLTFYEAPYEAGDGIGAARYVVQDPSHRGGAAPHVLLTQSFRDESVPNQSSEPLGALLDLQYVGMSISTPGLRFASMNTTTAPYAPTSGPTLAFTQYSPATHQLIAYTHSSWGYDMSFPPFVPLATPVSVTNPVPQVHRQVERFLVDFFSGHQPTVIDPFQ